MRTQLAHMLAASPILTLFVVIGLGWLLGQLEWRGFRLGVAGVLFVGLAVGALGPAVLIPEIVSSLGLVIFVYTIGIQAGPAFFSSFRARGYRQTLLAIAVLIFGAALTAGLARPLHLTPERRAGLYTGALTNTPALAASRERVREYAQQRGLPRQAAETLAGEPVLAYGIAYPFGVIGVILCLYLARRCWGVEFRPADDAPEIRVRNFVVENPAIFGQKLEAVLRPHRDTGFVVSRVRQRGQTMLARKDTELRQGDVVAVVGDDGSFERVQQIFGAPSNEHIELDRSQFDYRRVFVSSKQVVGRRIGDLDLADTLSATITRLRRGDADLVPTPQARLEYGDRVRVLTLRENFGAVSRFFGDSIRGTAETDFGSVAIGMVLGALVGMAPLPLPGGISVRLGLAGGALLVGLVLGRIERSGRITWSIPISANLTLRQIGLVLFLAGVGANAGYGFAATVRSNGLQLLAAGAVVTIGVTLITLIVGFKVLKIPLESVMGLVAGVQTQPAVLAYATDTTRSEAPDVAYAAVYPAAMIVKIILAQLLT